MMEPLLDRHKDVRRAEHVWRKAHVGPSQAERQILQEITRHGGLVVSYRNGTRTTTLADGKPLLQTGFFDLSLAFDLNWIAADLESPALLNGLPAQRYFVNTQFIEAR